MQNGSKASATTLKKSSKASSNMLFSEGVVDDLADVLDGLNLENYPENHQDMTGCLEMNESDSIPPQAEEQKISTDLSTHNNSCDPEANPKDNDANTKP